MRRVAQFFAHVRARVDPAEEEIARELLPPAALELFERMSVADRRHALDVADRLRAGGHDDPDLARAALLHDVAKGRRMRLWHRVAGVLLEAFAPAALRRLARDDSTSWRYPFHLYLHHASLSADLAEATGCGSRVADLIRGSVSPVDAHNAAALRLADDAS